MCLSEMTLVLKIFSIVKNDQKRPNQMTLCSGLVYDFEILYKASFIW